MPFRRQLIVTLLRVRVLPVQPRMPRRGSTIATCRIHRVNIYRSPIFGGVLCLSRRINENFMSPTTVWNRTIPHEEAPARLKYVSCEREQTSRSLSIAVAWRQLCLNVTSILIGCNHDIS